MRILIKLAQKELQQNQVLKNGRIVKEFLKTQILDLVKRSLN